MNNPRRKLLNDIAGKIAELKDELESVMGEEEEYRDNMPENLQNSEKYEMSESACNAMQEALDNLEEAIYNIETAQE